MLSSIGIYGLMSYIVSRRTNEIGIRIAIGASRANVRWLVMRDIVLLVAIGTAVGIPVTLAGSRFVANMLFGMHGVNWISLVGRRSSASRPHSGIPAGTTCFTRRPDGCLAI
jgi:ABC-type antimicrobial peptide transport system permease subunit